jgi:hypothetical protein
MANKRTPINRVNKFFSFEDFELEQSMGREAIEADGNFTIVLYRVDRDATVGDATYGEAGMDEIKFFPPVELKVIPTIAEPENKTYNEGSGSLRYEESGKLTFGLYQQQLDELAVDISYGDYIGYPVSETEIFYFTVVNDGKINFDNKHTIMGYKGTFRSVECIQTDFNEFRAY